ncbi:putative membrane protein [Leptospira ryugenii]|uniref:Putative membrane protein n=1 Tax=Leptospira ryugenii TaxID=1917863 RepID=A0A2P2E1M4_9LEPT|nr:hypothetical protein [Leptospira ryugenii]GBF50696.1 putative membrane protein [Leptospira ryugenii]
MNIKNKLPLIASILLFLLSLHSILVDFEIEIPTSVSLVGEEKIEAYENLQPVIVLKKGLWYRLDLIQESIRELGSEVVPVDSEPEESVDRLNRILIGQRILFFLYNFYIILCFSAFVTYLFDAWFYLVLNRLVLWPGLLFSIQLTTVYAKLLATPTFFYIAFFIFFAITFLVSLLALIQIEKSKKGKETKYEALKHSSSLEEEGRAPIPAGRSSYAKLLYHFCIIILTGIIIGNFVYIPLFLLQKYYVTEFTFLIFSLILLLSAFYIYNYGKVGGESKSSQFQNTVVSIAYLQYRFLRNGFMGIFATILVVFFVTLLFSLLLLNIDIIQNNTGLFGKGSQF